jgi:TnpA family transposase
MARLSILTKAEIDSLYAIPSLEDEDRAFVFKLEAGDQEYINTLKRDTARKVNYILQLGDYQSVNYFFTFSFQQVNADVKFIMRHYFPDQPSPKKSIARDYHYANRRQLLHKFGVRDADSKFHKELDEEAAMLAKRHHSSRFILQELLSYCQQKNIIRPAYSSMQEFVSNGLKSETNRLTNKLDIAMDKSFRSKLDNLLLNEELFYNLTLLRKDQKNFTTTEILKSIEKQQQIKELYQQSKALMPKLDISAQNIIYYADLAEHYTIQQLKTFSNQNLVRLYLLCYVHRRLLKINDHLIASFIHKITKYTGEADVFQRSKVDIAEAVDKERRKQASHIMAINIDKKIPDEQVRAKAFDIVPEAHYSQFLSDFKKPNLNRDAYRWKYYQSIAMTIKRNIRPVFKALDFHCASDELTKAVTFFKIFLASNKPFNQYQYQDVPVKFFPASLKPLLTFTVNKDKNKEKCIEVNKYEFMVYWQLKKGLADGTVFIKDSLSFRALEDELIDLEYWMKHKDDILKALNMPLLTTDITGLLNSMESRLKQKYKEVNRRIKSGENKSVVLHYNKCGELSKWTLPYNRLDDDINNPFFNHHKTINIGDVMRLTANRTGLMRAFTHIQPSYAKKAPIPEVVEACILANALGIEPKMMKAISDINSQDMDRTQKNFIRFQTLELANTIIMEQVSKLPIFSEYDLSDYGAHASVDGQKFATKYNTIKSRHSKKYFGTMRGVVLYSLNYNHLPLAIKVIGANEHESHYLLDIVENNKTEIDITSVSGDMHSVNRVNFALMHFFGYRFMPRFTKLGSRYDNNLVCFDDPEDYADDIIKPSTKVKKTELIQEWDNVLRILVSLALKKTTQSQIVRKLSSYKKTNPTLKALMALDDIIMTDYLLGYIDNKDERVMIQRSLCRGESYHQLSSKIAKISGGRMLNGKNEIELDINAESIRFLANCVIFYNATLLSNLYEHYLIYSPQKAKEITRLSPVAWQFINLIGNYKFYNSQNSIDIQEITSVMIEESKIDI